MSKYPKSEMPTKGQWVEFTVEETPKGKEAVNITVIQDGLNSHKETVEETSAPKIEDMPSESSICFVDDLGELNGVGPIYRELLQKANVSSCQEISGHAPDALLETLLSVNEKEQVTKRPPTLNQVKEWITLANVV